MTNRVVITGMGIVGPVGNDRETFLKNIFDSKVGIEKITKFDATQTGISVAGEVKDFDPKNSIGKKAAKRMDLFSQYAVHIRPKGPVWQVPLADRQDPAPNPAGRLSSYPR